MVTWWSYSKFNRGEWSLNICICFWLKKMITAPSKSVSVQTGWKSDETTWTCPLTFTRFLLSQTHFVAHLSFLFFSLLFWRSKLIGCQRPEVDPNLKPSCRACRQLYEVYLGECSVISQSGYTNLCTGHAGFESQGCEAAISCCVLQFAVARRLFL